MTAFTLIITQGNERETRVTELNQRRRLRLIPLRLSSHKAPARLELGEPEMVVLFQAPGWSNGPASLLFHQAGHRESDPLFTKADRLGVDLTVHPLQRLCLFSIVQVIHNRQMESHTGKLCGRNNQ